MGVGATEGVCVWGGGYRCPPPSKVAKETDVFQTIKVKFLSDKYSCTWKSLRGNKKCLKMLQFPDQVSRTSTNSNPYEKNGTLLGLCDQSDWEHWASRHFMHQYNMYSCLETPFTMKICCLVLFFVFFFISVWTEILITEFNQAI